MKGITPIVAVLVLLLRSVAWPCSCDRWVRFEQVRRSASLVVATRVVGQHPIIEGSGPALGVAAIDIEVLETLKGKEIGPRLRVWDQDVLTSCRHGLNKLPVGTLAVFALTRDVHPRQDSLEELRTRVEAVLAPDDYILANCRQQWRVFRDENDLRGYTKGNGSAGSRRSNPRLQRTALRAAAEGDVPELVELTS